MIDRRVLNRIIGYARLSTSDTVLEIGAGRGNLTEELARKAGRVIAIEADAELAAAIPPLKNVEILVRDALAMDFPPFDKVVSNLPYSISSPITFKLFGSDFDFGILMYQCEFAKRMAALPNSRDYGRLSITVQYFAEVELLEIVPRSAFSTPPNVDSAIVRLTPRPPPYEVIDEDFFMRFINAVFSQRRKKLRNAIRNNARLLGIKDVTDAMEKLPAELLERRAETISPRELAKMADSIYEKTYIV